MRVRAQHNPEKLAEVDTLLAKYGEQKLLSMVRKKYIHDPVRNKNPPREIRLPPRRAKLCKEASPNGRP